MSSLSYKVGDVVTIASEYSCVFRDLFRVNCDKNSTFMVKDIEMDSGFESGYRVMLTVVHDSDSSPSDEWFDSNYF